MKVAPAYEDVTRSLAHAFRERYEETPGQHVRLTGLLFAPIGSPLARAEIIPRLQDYHYRSADNIDFFFAGYGYGGEAPGYIKVPNAPTEYWVYSAERFNAFCRELEAMTQWKYRGGCELLLANAKYDDAAKEASIDFGTTVVCDLDQMKTDKAIESVARFFESVFNFAKEHSGEDPAWGFSDKSGSSTVGSAILRLILSLLPKNLGQDVRKIQHFAVRDVSPA